MINNIKIAIRGLKSRPLYDGIYLLIGFKIGVVILYRKSDITETI